MEPMNGKVVEQWAGHYSDGHSSDKVWAAAYTDQGEFMVAYGRRPNATNGGMKTFGSEAAARDHYQRKLAEKRTKGYTEVAFDDHHFGLRAFGPVAAPSATESSPDDARVIRQRAASARPSAGISAARVYAIDADALDRARLDPGQGDQREAQRDAGRPGLRWLGQGRGVQPAGGADGANPSLRRTATRAGRPGHPRR